MHALVDGEGEGESEGFSDEQRLDRINNIRGQLPHLEEGPDKARLMGELAQHEGKMHRKRQRG